MGINLFVKVEIRLRIRGLNLKKKTHNFINSEIVNVSFTHLYTCNYSENVNLRLNKCIVFN